MKRILIAVTCLGALGAALHFGLAGCEIESGECTEAPDISVTFKVTARLLDKNGDPAAGAPGYIRTSKKVCDGTEKSVAPLKTTASPLGDLIVIHGYNLRNLEDRVSIEAGFDDYTPHHTAVQTYTYDELKSQSQTINVSLTVQAL